MVTEQENEQKQKNESETNGKAQSPASSPTKENVHNINNNSNNNSNSNHNNEEKEEEIENTTNFPTIKSKSENNIPSSRGDTNSNNTNNNNNNNEDEEKDATKNARRNRRKFVMNHPRGFMGVPSMETAKLVDEYQLLQVLGQGFYGKVFLATSVNSSSGEIVAIKQLDDRKFLPEQFSVISQEFSSLHRIINKNIVSYKQILLDDNLIYVVTEFVDNGSIYDLIQRSGNLSEPVIARFVKQILSALSHLQDLKIVHRDLKCSNVLLTKSGECKITDFELSHKHESNRYTIRGAPYWMAPEVIELTAGLPTCASDIWALGCIIVEMLTGDPPYRKLGPMSALIAISRDDHPPLPATISPDLKDFLLHCFAKDPAKRFTAKMLKEHAFLKVANDAEGHTGLPVRFSVAPSPSITSPSSSIASPSPAASIPSSSHSASITSSSSSSFSSTSSPTAIPPSIPSSSSSSTSTSSSTTPPSAAPPSQVSPFKVTPSHSSQHLSVFFDKNIVIDVYTEQDKEDYDLLEMTSDKQETPEYIDENFQFKSASSFAPKSGESEIENMKREIEYLRRLNEENVSTGLRLKDKYKKNIEFQEQLIALAQRMRVRADAAVENMRQAAKATAHSNMLLKRTNQVATESLANGAIVTANIRKLEEYVLEGDPAGKKLMGIVFKKSVTPENLVNPTLSGYLWYNTHLKSWKKDKEKRAWFVLKDNFLFAFKNDKGVAVEGVYLGEGARLVPLSEEQCKKKFCFRVADIFLVATDTAELCSEWMLALSKPQKWYESSYEDTTVSPRAARKGSDDISDSPPPLSISSPLSQGQPASTLNANSSVGATKKGRSGSAGSPQAPQLQMPIFGVPIEDLFAREGGNVPYFLLRIIQFLEEKGLQEEGILRISGSLSEINGLKDALQHGEDVDYSHHDPHAVAGLLKVFFRELPMPIIPEPYHSRILEVMFNQEMLDDQRVVEVKMILDQLPSPNRATLRILMSFLVHVNCNADKNKMTIQNLITCMVPTIKCVPGVFMYVIPNFDFVFDD